MAFATRPPVASEVKDATTFCAWVQGYLGGPYPTKGDFAILNKKASEFFRNYENADWQTLVQVAEWCQSRKRRMARVWNYVDQFRFAYAAHAIELKPRNDLDTQIAEALRVEKNPNWRSRLRRAVGVYREEVLEEWTAMRASTT